MVLSSVCWHCLASDISGCWSMLWDVFGGLPLVAAVALFFLSECTMIMPGSALKCVLSDSLSSLKALRNNHYEHPFLINNHGLYTKLIRDGKEIVFVWVPGYVGFRGNLAPVSTGKDACVGDFAAKQQQQ